MTDWWWNLLGLLAFGAMFAVPGILFDLGERFLTGKWPDHTYDR
jgi:hypothetical protein